MKSKSDKQDQIAMTPLTDDEVDALLRAAMEMVPHLPIPPYLRTAFRAGVKHGIPLGMERAAGIAKSCDAGDAAWQVGWLIDDAIRREIPGASDRKETMGPWGYKR
jgi:hypothetical protein